MSKDKTAGEKFPFVFVKLCFSITTIFFAVNLKRSTSVPFLPQGKGGQQVGKILGVRRADAQRRTTNRMANLDRFRVESLTGKRARRWCEVPQRRAAHSVYFISNQGVSDCSQVDAELVGPAGFREQTHQRDSSRLGHDLITTHCRTAVPGADRHLLAVNRVAANW